MAYFILLAVSCNFSDRKLNDFCSSTTGWDYVRIPLSKPADLIRLKGDDEWGFSFTRANIDSPIVSDLINVKKIGVFQKSFVLVTAKCEYKGNTFEKRALYFSKSEGEGFVYYYEKEEQIDSLFQNKRLEWYNIDDVWRNFSKTKKVPWCDN